MAVRIAIALLELVSSTQALASLQPHLVRPCGLSRARCTLPSAPPAILRPKPSMARPSRPATLMSAAEAAEDGAAAPSKGLLTSVINLSKNIICGGFLSLPAGVACCARYPNKLTLAPAMGLLLVMGALSAYCFGLIGRTCAITREPTYDAAWSRAIGPGSRWLIKGSLAAKTGVTCLSYSMILADSVSQLSVLGRSTSLFAVTGSLLLPLCMLDTSTTFGLLKCVALGLHGLPPHGTPPSHLV